ncbi:arylesterase [Mucilaginibacter sp. HMF5004]|nr:arylesterase [Mucilaginibacter rivuli]
MPACGSPDNNKAETTTHASATAPAQSANTKTILVFGDSLTAGYGLDDAASESYPSIIQQKIDSAGLAYKVVNGGLSGETSAGGLGRIDWLLRQKVDVFILELGANDGLRGLPVEQTAKNLQKIIDKVKGKYPDVKIILTGMMVPPNMGADYANNFKAVFPELAKRNNVSLIPFLLSNVAGNPGLNQKDGIHPTAKGAKIVAQNVWEGLQPLLQ